MWRLERLIRRECFSIADEEFVNLVYTDISLFLEKNIPRCVLVFPPLNNRSRYLIHKVGELFSLATFSIGEGTTRLTVVCTANNFLDNVTYLDNPVPVTHEMESTPNKGAVSKSKRPLRPDAPIYIPPAFRKAQNVAAAEKNNDKAQSTSGKQVNVANNDKKQATEQLTESNELPVASVPDKSVIKAKVDETNTNEWNKEESGDLDKEELLRASEEINRRNKIIMKPSFPKSDLLIIINPNDSTSSDEWNLSDEESKVADTSATNSDTVKPSAVNRNVADLNLADLNIAEPNAADLNTAELNDAVSIVADLTVVDLSISEPNAADPIATDLVAADSNIAEPNAAKLNIAEPNAADPIATDLVAADSNIAESNAADLNIADPIATDLVSGDSNIAEPNPADPIATDLVAADSNIAEPNAADFNIADPIATGLVAGDSNIAEPNPADPIATDLVAADLNIAEPTTADSNITEPKAADPRIAEPNAADPGIAEPNAANPIIAEPKAVNPSISEPTVSVPVAEVPVAANPSIAVENWEQLVDGNDVTEDIVHEITRRVGNVKIIKTNEDYKDYKEKVSIENFPHIVELYGFPSEFQTRDFISIFEIFNCGKYHIKWVDDTHALGIFTTAFAVNEILKLEHPLVKVRPLSQGSRQSLMKAKSFSSASLLPAVRPQTSVHTARRLVSGALGLKLQNSSEERAKERKLLKEAREKKRLSIKQQEDIWEGRITQH